MRSFRCPPHIAPWVGDKPIAVRHLNQWQGLRVHDVLLADNAVEVKEIGGHRVHLVGREGAGVVEWLRPAERVKNCLPRGCSLP
jgi:hypothetical protein